MVKIDVTPGLLNQTSFFFLPIVRVLKMGVWAIAVNAICGSRCPLVEFLVGYVEFYVSRYIDNKKQSTCERPVMPYNV